MRPPKMIELPAPRALEAHEAELLDFLLASDLARPELREQAATVQVVSTCDCGCRSVGIAPAESAPLAPYTDSECDLPGYFYILAQGFSESGAEVDVMLHIVEGHMSEIEVWGDGGACGELPVMSSLRQAGQ